MGWGGRGNGGGRGLEPELLDSVSLSLSCYRSLLSRCADLCLLPSILFFLSFSFCLLCRLSSPFFNSSAHSLHSAQMGRSLGVSHTLLHDVVEREPGSKTTRVLKHLSLLLNAIVPISQLQGCRQSPIPPPRGLSEGLLAVLRLGSYQGSNTKVL